MKDFAIIIKKNNYEKSIIKDNIFYIKSILYYGLNIDENNVLFLNFSYNIEDYYANIVFIKEYAYNVMTIPKKSVYVYIDNSEDDLLEDTYDSYYFYSILELFYSKAIFIQYAGIILYDKPIFKYYLSNYINNIRVELSDVRDEFNTTFVIVDNYKINDMVLNLIEMNDNGMDFFNFILNNIKCTMYSNVLISKNNYIFKNDIGEEISIFKYHSNLLITNFLKSIYELNNDDRSYDKNDDKNDDRSYDRSYDKNDDKK